MANNQVEQLKSDNAFDFSIEQVDCFKFQNKNFKEEKAKLTMMIQEENEENDQQALSRTQKLKLR